MFIAAMAPLALIAGLVFLSVLPGLIMRWTEISNSTPAGEREPQDAFMRVAEPKPGIYEGYWPDTYVRLTREESQDLIRQYL